MNMTHDMYYIPPSHASHSGVFPSWMVVVMFLQIGQKDSTAVGDVYRLALQLAHTMRYVLISVRVEVAR